MLTVSRRLECLRIVRPSARSGANLQGFSSSAGMNRLTAVRPITGPLWGERYTSRRPHVAPTPVPFCLSRLGQVGRMGCGLLASVLRLPGRREARAAAGISAQCGQNVESA